MSSKYRLRFCRAEGDLSHPVTPKPSLVRTLGGECFLLPLIQSLFTSGTRFFNGVSQIEYFRTKVDRIVHLVLNRWTLPDHPKDV